MKANGKILFVASVSSHLRGFHLPFMRWFQERGWRVETAANDETGLPVTDAHHVIPFSRSPFSRSNIAAYRQLRELLVTGGFDIVHCHTPVAAMLTRLAARSLRSRGLRVIYTAHGFHFWKGAPLKNWLAFYPVEKLCSYFTDDLITINREDEAFARAHLNARHTHYVAGVGVDLTRFAPNDEERRDKRRELNLDDSQTLLLTVGELSVRKNQEVILRAMAAANRPEVHLAFAGRGDLRESYAALARELGIADRIHFLGFRNDVQGFFNAADLFLFPSLQEGLSVALMEALACRLPVIASRIRGNSDLITDGVNGRLLPPRDVVAWQQALTDLLDHPGSLPAPGLPETYTLPAVLSAMADIYSAANA